MPSVDFTLPLHDPVLIFALVMVIILVAPLLFTRLRIPGLVGLIAFGALVGPSVLGLLERDATFELLGTVGLLYLMFTAGLSIDMNQFARLRVRSLVFGLLSFTLPLLLALVVGRGVLGYAPATALLLGAIVGSHTLLAYPIASRLGITKNTAVIMTMGGTVVTDLVSLLVLAVVTAGQQGQGGVGFWLTFAGLVAAYSALVLAGLPRLGRWFFRTVRDQSDVGFVFLVAVLFLSAYGAALVGLAPIIGAFMTGLVMNRLVPEAGPLMGRIRFVGNALFIPFFLISVGMLVDVRVLFSSLDVWALALVFTALVLAGKGAAAWLVRWIYGYTPAEGWTVFGLSAPQAAATLAVTLVGFELGFFSATAVNAVIVLILLTCLVGPWLVERYGRQVAVAERERPYEPASAPQRILVPLANPETADALVDVALLIHDPASEQPIYPLAIARTGPEEAGNVAAAEELLSHAVIHAAAADTPVVPLTRLDLNVASGIVRAVKEQRISTIVIGWNGESTARGFIFGTILDQLLDQTHEMVLVCRLPQPLNTTGRVVLAVPPFAEHEPGFGAAVRAVKILAAQTGATLVIAAAGEGLATLKPLVRRVRPEVPVLDQPLPAWGGLVEGLDGLLRPADLLVLLGTRQGSLAWRPALNRLPRLLAHRYAEHNFITLYAPDALPEAAVDVDARALVAPEHVRVGLGGEDLAAVLQAMLLPLMEDRPALLRRTARLLASRREGYNPELMPGAVLYHAHVPGLPAPVLRVGVSAEGLNLKGTAHPAHLVLLLLTPATMGTEAYLRLLNEAARLVRDAEALERLRAAATPEAVVRLLTTPAVADEAAAASALPS